MSLVNDVLEELDRRESPDERSGHRPLTDVELSRFGTPLTPQQSQRRFPIVPWVLAGAGVVVLLFEAVVSWQSVVGEMFAAPAVSARPPATAPLALDTTEAGDRDAFAATIGGYEELRDVEVRAEDGYTRIFFHLTGEREYWLQGDPAHGEIEVVISGTRLATALAPFAFQGSGVLLQEAHNTSNGLHLLLSFEPAARIQSQVAYGDAGPTLVIDVIDGQAREEASAKPGPRGARSQVVEPKPKPKAEAAKSPAASPTSWGMIQQTHSATRRNQLDASASFDRAQRFAVAGEHKEAIAEYVRALAVNPDLHRAREALVILLIEGEHFQAATRHLDQAIARAPGHSEYNFLKAQLLVATRQSDRAIAVLESLPTPPARRSDALNLLAALYQQGGDHERAETLFRHAVQLAPHEARLWMGLGISLEGQQRQTEALAVYKQADSLARFETGPRRWLKSRIRELSSLE